MQNVLFSISLRQRMNLNQINSLTKQFLSEDAFIGATTLSITTLGILTLSIPILCIKNLKCNTQHNAAQHYITLSC